MRYTIIKSALQDTTEGCTTKRDFEGAAFADRDAMAKVFNVFRGACECCDTHRIIKHHVISESVQHLDDPEDFGWIGEVLAWMDEIVPCTDNSIALLSHEVTA